MKRIGLFSFLLLSAILLGNLCVAQKGVANVRTIVTSDGEVDDIDSFIRFLLYTNEINVVGLIYSSSEFHYQGDGKGTTFTSKMPMAKLYGKRTTLRWLGTEWMQSLIDTYAQVYDNLVKHDKKYPSPAHLKSLIRIGNIDFEGEMDHDTEGSDFIKNLLLDNKPEPLYLQIWGGTNTVARALKSIEDQYKDTPEWKAIYQKVSEKTILNIILDQDETYKNYIALNWPDVHVIYNASQFWGLAYGWKKLVTTQFQMYLGGKWHAENIKFNHGHLLSRYYLWGDGNNIKEDPFLKHGDTTAARRRGFSQYEFISEGDSPAYLSLINTGLRSWQNPSYGGWGGRFVPNKANARIWQDGKEVTDYNSLANKQDSVFAQTRWIDAIQNDFAARADWCIKSYKEANHAPSISLKQPESISAKAGETIRLICSAKDPDGNSVNYSWWHYKEAGTFSGAVDIQNPDKAATSFLIPADAKQGETIHIILAAKDNGTPQLTSYKRVILTVGPN